MYYVPYYGKGLLLITEIIINIKQIKVYIFVILSELPYEIFGQPNK